MSSTESFNPAKIEDTSITIDLTDLILKDIPPHNGAHLGHWKHENSDYGYIKNRTGTSYMYGHTDSDYNLNGYEFTIKDNGAFHDWNIQFNNKQSIGLSMVNDKLKWIFYLQATLGKIENRIIIDIVPAQYGYAYIATKSLKINIYKIILNNR